MNTANLITGDGKTFTVSLETTPDISQNFVFSNFQDSTDIDGWRSFLEDMTVDLTKDSLKFFTSCKLRVSCTGIYQLQDGGYSEPLTMNSKYQAKITRHHASLASRVRNQFLAVFSPAEYSLRLQEEFASKIGYLVAIQSFQVSVLFPLEYQTLSLATSQRLHKCFLTDNLSFLPRNSDKYCILHCIFNKLKYQVEDQTKSLNRDEEYMKKFQEWVDFYNLKKFYIDDDIFNLDAMEEMEEILETSINWYTFSNDQLELYYRSSYRFQEQIINLVAIPMEYFYDNNLAKSEKDRLGKKVKKNFPIISMANAKDYLSHISIQNAIRPIQAHCAILDETAFYPIHKGGKKNYHRKICKFCTGAFYPTVIDIHERDCGSSFNEKNMRNRLKVYRDPNPEQSRKIFKKYEAMMRVPFCTYDFETKNQDGRHYPVSYAILYFNIFQPELSRQWVYSNFVDSDDVIENFLLDIQEAAYHAYLLQSVDRAQNIPEGKPEEGSQCEICLQPGKKFEFNHSHFQGDNLNLHLNKFMCHTCNMALCYKSKPIKFFAHNGSRFDQNLFLAKLLNSDKFTNFEFLAKTESRFTQVTCALSEKTTVKISFNDSKMIVNGSLGALAKAWITEADDRTLLKLLSRFYSPNKVDLESLIKISKRKQVFPYQALNDPANLEVKEISKELFHDSLFDKEISNEDYAEYLNANKTLEQALKGTKRQFNFYDYHDFYLTLDVVLLAMVLNNFSEVCYATNQLNPLTYVSVSGYSFGCMLFNNKYSEKNIPEIKIPCYKVSNLLQRSIHGGFTQIFNKKPQDFNENDRIDYLDVNSLYPSAMATCKLPYEFEKWIEPEEKSVEELLNYFEENSEDKYFFIEVDIAALAPEFQDKVSTFPLFPENITLKPEMLSDDQRYRFQLNSMKRENELGSVIKEQTINTVTFYRKERYVTSYSYLKFAIALGYRVEKIHSIAQFKADFVMSDYVKKIYELKKLASQQKNEIQKRIDAGEENLSNAKSALECKITSYKILANGLYGSCLVNQERHSETQIFDDKEDIKKIKKQISSLRFKSYLHCGNKSLICRQKQITQISYPLSLGSAILFESKLIVAKFVYKLREFLLQNKLQPQIMLMTDTDSVVFQIKNFYSTFKSYDEFAYRFNNEVYAALDTSFAKEECFQMPETHEAFSMFKDETKGGSITDFAGLCAKVYSYTVDNKHSIKSKGISKEMQKKHLTHQLYHDIIAGVDIERVRLCQYGSFNINKMQVNEIRVNKSYCSLVDLKSFYGKNGTIPVIFGSDEHLGKLTKN